MEIKLYKYSFIQKNKIKMLLIEYYKTNINNYIYLILY